MDATGVGQRIILCLLLWCAFYHNSDACDTSQDQESDSFLCTLCGETIANAHQLKHFQSSLALKEWNKTILGIQHVPVQLFQNPHGEQFNVVTLLKGNVKTSETAYADASWFPGFAWKISVCPRCGMHMGWTFLPINFNHLTHSEEDTFLGLVLDNVLEERASNSLLLVPNSYKS